MVVVVVVREGRSRNWDGEAPEQTTTVVLGVFSTDRDEADGKAGVFGTRAATDAVGGCCAEGWWVRRWGLDSQEGNGADKRRFVHDRGMILVCTCHERKGKGRVPVEEVA